MSIMDTFQCTLSYRNVLENVEKTPEKAWGRYNQTKLHSVLYQTSDKEHNQMWQKENITILLNNTRKYLYLNCGLCRNFACIFAADISILVLIFEASGHKLGAPNHWGKSHK